MFNSRLTIIEHLLAAAFGATIGFVLARRAQPVGQLVHLPVRARADDDLERLPA